MNEKLRKKLIQAGADTDGALERFMGNEGLYTRFARGFREDGNYDALLKAMEAGDVKAAFNAAHTLKGVTGNLSFNRLYEKVSEVVEPLRREDLEEAGKKLPALTDAYEELIRVLEEWEA
ncbi:MAG TPA: Hpt domain-containing protein [Candidatus Merdisoma merdipullorum]|nr:Hpt domain-containing protein [Candidatus Merdisoma merdipullorum]